MAPAAHTYTCSRCQQCGKSGWNSGGTQWRIQKAWGRGWVMGRGTPPHQRKGSEEGAIGPCSRNNFSFEMTCFGALWEVFLSMSLPDERWIVRQKVVIWCMDVENVHMVSSEHSIGVMELVSFLLYCNASILLLFETWQNLGDKLH